MRKIIVPVAVFLFVLGILTLPAQAAVYSLNLCDQYKGVKKIWWDGIELRSGQIGRLIVKQNTPLFKLEGNKRTFSRTLKAGEFYRIYAFKPGMLSVGGGYYVDRDVKVTYQTPSKTKLQAVMCINKPYGTRSNPTSRGDAWNVQVKDWDGNKHYQISLVDVIEGEDAWQMIKQANMFNDAPPAGMKYVLTKFRTKLFAADEEPFLAASIYFNAVSRSGVVYENAYVVSPEPELWTELYDGGETEGWVVFLVEEDDVPLIVWNKDDKDEIWFKIK